jgi:hypothetical protein
MKVHMRDGSGWRKYRNIVEDTDRHGNVRVYYRPGKGKPKLRLISTPGTTEFETEYQRARNGELAPTARQAGRAIAAPGTMRWLCEQYYSSAAFQALEQSTRKVRRSILDAICERAGSFKYSTLEPHNVAKLRDEKAAFPEAANARVKALRRLFAWACSPEYRYATRNPAAEVPYLKSNNPDGFREWPEDQVALYEARHPVGTKARLALDLLHYTGVRRSDVVNLGPQMERWVTSCRMAAAPRAHRNCSSPRRRVAVGSPRRMSCRSCPRSGAASTPRQQATLFISRLRSAGRIR